MVAIVARSFSSKIYTFLMKPFVSPPLPPKLDAGRLIEKIGPARHALALYDGKLQGIINPSVMLSPLLTNESVLSSRIEGTQATVDEVFEYEAGAEFEREKTHDIQEVINYRKTLSLGAEVLEEQPVSIFLIKQMHQILMDSVRGQDKNPGQIRKDQNWIGPKGCKIEDATFVPPTPLALPAYLDEWAN